MHHDNALYTISRILYLLQDLLVYATFVSLFDTRPLLRGQCL